MTAPETQSPQRRKKLIEVALPLDAINRGCESDKNRKTGHIRNLHKWFAPMPLPAWRTLLLAAVLDDPGEGLSPHDANRAREEYFALIERLSPLDSYADDALMAEVRSLIRSQCDDATLPTVVDPFCGGASTIVEAQRLGFPTIAADLNPIPVTIAVALCRIPQLLGSLGPVASPLRSQQSLLATTGFMRGLLADVRHYAERIRQTVWTRLGHLYPLGPNGDTVIAWRWAWTVPSPDPSRHGLRVPLVTNWALTGSDQGGFSVQPVVGTSDVRFQVVQAADPQPPTAGGRRLTCLASGQPITNAYVRAAGQAGELLPSLLCCVCIDPAGRRSFVPASELQLNAAAQPTDVELPSLPMPEEALGFRIQEYGFRDYRDLFLHRQAATIAAFADAVAECHSHVLSDALRAGLHDDTTSLDQGGRGARAYADAITVILSMCLDRMAMSNNILVQWFIDPRSGGGKATPAFRMQNISMVWDFVETNPFADSVGGWCGPVLESVLSSFALVAHDAAPAVVVQGDARTTLRHIPENSLVATDPPYYANIGYADLSDFFYPWLRRCLRAISPQVFSTVATPKAEELIAASFRHGGRQAEADKYFRDGFIDVFTTARERTSGAYPTLVIYALKQGEAATGAGTGWEVFLDGVLASGMSVVATWPVRTTTLTRTRAIGSNALASAICVVCRPRPLDAVVETRRRFLDALKTELPTAFRQLQQSNIAPVDLAQAAIGPGMAIFSRYSGVVDAGGRTVSVGEALAAINQVLDEALAEQESDFDSDSRWALTWFDQHGFAEGDFGIAETLSKAKNTSVMGLQEAGIVKASRGKVRLLKPSELRPDWDPASDTRLTTWELVHYLIRALEKGGESEAADLVAKLGTKAEAARELCYRLFTLCERNKRATEAGAYNALVQSWPEISRLARDSRRPVERQAEMFTQRAE